MLQRSNATGSRNSEVAPCIIGICSDSYTTVIIDGNNIALQVLFKPICVKLAFSIRSVSILHTNGTSISIVEIQNKIIAPLFSHDQRVTEMVDVLNTVNSFAGSDSFVVVFEGEVI